ncbi:MAG: M23 family peptidase, partial [Actinobacteria bacterium]
MVGILNVYLIAALCIAPPVPGPVTATFAPVGQYAGHWGLDFEASFDDVVAAPASGVVTFAGSVAGMKSITVQPLPGLKVSVSYLSSISVVAGQYVTRGQPIGAAGAAHGETGTHLSLRIGDVYTDPQPWLGCHHPDISRALRLVTPPQPYPR